MKLIKEIFLKYLVVKLILVFVLICTLLIVGLSFLYYYNISNEKYNDYSQHSMSILELGSQNLEMSINEIDSSIKVLFESSWIWNDVVNINKTQFEQDKYMLEQNVYVSMLNLYNFYDNVHSVSIYIPTVETLYVIDAQTPGSAGSEVFGENFVIENVKAHDIPWYENTAENPHSLNITTSSLPYNISRPIDNEGGYRFARALQNPFTNNTVLSVCIEMRRQEMDLFLEPMREPSEEILIVSGDEIIYAAESLSSDDIISSDTLMFNNYSQQSGTIRGETSNSSTITYYKTNIDDWYILKSIQNNVLNKQLSSSVTIYVIYSILASVVGIIVVTIIAFRFTAPIMQLKHEIIEFDGTKLPQKFKERKDELGQLQDKFYEMGARISHLVGTEYILKIREKEARINAIQQRVNPHFLNNALQTINALAVQEGNRNVEHVVQSLKNILQYNLNTSDGFTIFRKELSASKDYIEIQKYRYPNRINVEYDISPGTLSLIMPSFIMQPILENSFHYGFANTDGLFKIRISSYFSNDNFTIDIWDSGQGFSNDSLIKLTEEFKATYTATDMTEKGNGLKIVNSLIKLSYGEKYGVAISCGKDYGVTVTLCLPIHQGGEYV